jgi:hypothetical protein
MMTQIDALSMKNIKRTPKQIMKPAKAQPKVKKTSKKSTSSMPLVMNGSSTPNILKIAKGNKKAQSKIKLD